MRRSRQLTRLALLLSALSLGGAALGPSARGDGRKALPTAAPQLGDAIVTVDGFELATPRARGATGGIVARLPRRADGRLAFTTARGTSFGVRRVGARPAEVRLAAGALVADDGLAAPTWFAAPHAIEELLELRGPEDIVYELDLPRGLVLREATPAVVEIVDAAGTPRARVTADRAWDAKGAPVEVRLVASGDLVRVELGEAGAYPIVVDPAWSDAGSPVKIRSDHTATLLPDGEVFLAGGLVSGAPDATAELFDPVRGTFTATGGLRSARAQHTATLLASGRVLIAAGLDATGAPVATAEIYDPATARSAATGSLSEPRALQAATRLGSGKVLLSGGSANPTADIFDPATGTFAASASAMTSARPAPSATLLLDGQVLVVGPADADVYDPPSDTFTPAGAYPANVFPPTPDLTPMAQSANLLIDGRVIIAGGCPCGSVGGPTFYSPRTLLFDPTTLAFDDGPTFGGTVPDGQTGTLLPSGEVLLAGDLNGFTEVPRLDSGASAWTYDDALATGHSHHTATLLPSGDVLVVGGTQAAAELYDKRGGEGPGAFTDVATMPVALSQTRGAVLLDGRVLVAGGYDDLGSADATPDPSAQIYDPTGGAPIAAMLDGPRGAHTITALADGRALVAGGYAGNGSLATALAFDPSSNTFASVGMMTTPRQGHTATLLPSGKVLIAGGYNAGYLASAELFDPKADAFAATGPMNSARSNHAAILLPTGKVLVVGGSTADLYDPVDGTFTAATSPGGSHVAPTLSLLADGRALLFGPPTLAAEIYDPLLDAWSFTGPASEVRNGHAAVGLGSGKVLIVGGHPDGLDTSSYADGELFDPAANGGQGAFTLVTGMSAARSSALALELVSGSAFIAGGRGCFGDCIGYPASAVDRFDETSDLAAPGLASAPAQVVPGSAVAITGSRLTGLEGSGGRQNASHANVPIAVWTPLSGAGVVVGTLSDFTDTAATWHVPATALYGQGRLAVIVDGVRSTTPLTVEIVSAPNGVGCADDYACSSTFCTDGVCCDARCDGACDGCTKAKKGSGADGTCGTVPPERFSSDACFVTLGAPCTIDGACEHGLVCVDGVCCAEACSGQCEACDVAGSVGQCVPVIGAPHGQRDACMASSNACDNKVCDGSHRDACDATVGPCTPFACGDDTCKSKCASDADCADDFHCDDTGACVPGLCNGTVATTANGKKVDCAPYVCVGDGTCRTSCGRVEDCADGFVCDLSSRCVAPPAPDVLGGCQCALPGSGSNGEGTRSAFTVSLLALVIALLRRITWRSPSPSAPSRSRRPRPSTRPESTRACRPTNGS